MPVRIFAIHGAGEQAGVWRAQSERLPGVQAIDLPGHGRNSGPGRASIGEYAEWVDRYAGSTPTILAGHSMGGAIALEVALRKPAWLAGLLLVGTGARLRVHPDLLEMLRSDFPAAVEWMVERSTASSSPRGVRDSYRGMLLSAGPDLILADLLACDRFDVMGRLGEISIPARAIVGTLDRMTPPKYSEYLRKHMSDCDMTEVPGAGHMVTLETGDAVAAAMGGFLLRV